MPKKAKKSGKKGKKGRSPPSSSAVVFKGNKGITFASFVQAPLETTAFVTHGATTQNLVSSSGGLNTDVISNIVVANLADWTQLALTWAEIRVLGMRMHYVPYNKFNRGDVNTVPGGVCFTRDSSTALAALTAALSKENSKTVSLDESWTIETYMDEVEEAVYIPLGSYTANGILWWYKAYFSGLTVSTTYGLLVSEFIYELKGRI